MSTIRDSYSDHDRATIGRMVGQMIEYSRQQSPDPRVAISAFTSVLLFLFDVLASVGSIEAAHKMIDQTIAMLQTLRKATTAEEITENLRSLSQGEVDERGVIEEFKRH